MRTNSIDFVRGIAFILMLIHHYHYFNPAYTVLPKHVKTIGLISRSLFIFLVGFNIKFFYKSKINYFSQFKLLISAIIVTVTTIIFLPHDRIIFFGILHFISISSLLMKHLAFNYSLIIAVAISCKIINDLYIKNNISKNYFMISLGGMSFDKSPIDIFQLLDWLPLVCYGIIAGGIFKSYFSDKLTYKENIITKPIEFIGKNSLFLYVLHIVPCIYWMKSKFN